MRRCLSDRRPDCRILSARQTERAVFTSASTMGPQKEASGAGRLVRVVHAVQGQPDHRVQLQLVYVVNGVTVKARRCAGHAQ